MPLVHLITEEILFSHPLLHWVVVGEGETLARPVLAVRVVVETTGAVLESRELREPPGKVMPVEVVTVLYPTHLVVVVVLELLALMVLVLQTVMAESV